MRGKNHLDFNAKEPRTHTNNDSKQNNGSCGSFWLEINEKLAKENPK